MTNTEIASKLVTVRRGEKKLWNVYAPGLPGMRKLQAAFTVKKDAEAHAFHIAAHVAAILDAADSVKKQKAEGGTQKWKAEDERHYRGMDR